MELFCVASQQLALHPTKQLHHAACCNIHHGFIQHIRHVRVVILVSYVSDSNSSVRNLICAGKRPEACKAFRYIIDGI